MKTYRSVDLCGPICKQERTQSAVATQISVCTSFWETRNLGAEIAPSLLQCIVLTVSGNWTDWLCVQSVVIVTRLQLVVVW